MSNRIMLINGRHAEELRVAIVEDGILQLYDVEGAVTEQKRGNIYRGVVTNIERSLNAAFVDFGDGKQGFLTRHDVIPQAFHRKADDRAPIDKILQKGKSLIVQITRDAEGSKGAALTTNLSLAGRFLVFFPYDEQRGVSRKVEDEALRRKLREKAKGLDVGEGEGFIVRTNGADQTKVELKADLTILKRLWKAVLDDSKTGQGAKFLYNDQDLLIHSMRDNLDSKIDEVLIDDEQLHARAQKYLQAVMPRSKVSLKNYTERTPLFSRYNIEPQIAGLYQRTVGLPCRGSIVIDHTEALTAIDVNSGKAKVGKTQGDTAYQTNLEAAAEVARQLRLRDIGGLVVVDFIDMRARQQERAVEKVLKEAMKQDRARHQIGRVSENGLLEINRQRIRRPLQLRTHRLCPTCEGVGQLLSPELISLSLIRRIGARAAAGQLGRVRVGLHPELANFTQNHRRREISEVEQKYNIAVEIIGDLSVELSGERLEWIDLDKNTRPAAVARPKGESTGTARRKKVVTPPAPAPSSPPEAKKEKADESTAETESAQRPRRKRRRRGRGRGRGRNGQAQEQNVQGKGEKRDETPTRHVTPPKPQPQAPALAQSSEVSGNVIPPGGEKPRQEKSGQPSSRRQRGRRRRRPQGEEAAARARAGNVQLKEPAAVPRSITAQFVAASQDSPQAPTPQAPTPRPVVAPQRSTEQRKSSAPTPPPAPVDRASETRPEPAREAVTPRAAAPQKNAPKEAAPAKEDSQKAAPKKAAPKKAAPKKAAPKKAAPKKAAPKKAAPKKAAPKKAAPKKAAPKKAAPMKAEPGT